VLLLCADACLREQVRLVPGPWTPESGLVTAALKVRRQSVQAAFKRDVDDLLRQKPEA
jgi:hypothetical protein